MAHFDSTLDMAKTQVALRALRYGHFPADIFDEYAWDMLLHMYIASLREQPQYVDNVVNLTSKNKHIGDRWIRHLTMEGLASLDGDRVSLTPDGFSRMDKYHMEAIDLLE
jgi:hypothetical protein